MREIIVYTLPVSSSSSSSRGSRGRVMFGVKVDWPRTELKVIRSQTTLHTLRYIIHKLTLHMAKSVYRI